ncbi:RepA family replication protein, partial [Serratia nevei]|uniref:RepA family replication protein n=2 Tax=Serratia TaxID=613 RepID=UPI002E18002E|nr:RepA family replication protein [Serratia nevei]MEC6071445.1 RepA family replication protein [Serratia nevei]
MDNRSTVQQASSARSRGCYVSNPFPTYQSPKAGANKPALIRALVTAARENQPARHEAWYTTPRVQQKTGLTRPVFKR